MILNNLKEQITTFAKAEGFSFVGFSKAEFLKDEAPKLEKWLKNGNHGSMSYMENHFDKRLDPRLLVPGAKSVISLLFNYFPGKFSDPDSDKPKIASYAKGADYHYVLKEKLNSIITHIQSQINSEFIYRVFVDSAPVMERQWAQKSGLGWLGKNTLLINKTSGSFFFLAEIITELEFEPDSPIKDYCGTCTACIDACPTDALSPYLLDASKCISYLTIELKDQIPAEFGNNELKNWVFGCDICQEVCPWNRFSKPHSEKAFLAQNNWEEWEFEKWETLSNEEFNKTFKNSPLKRAGIKGIKKNLDALKRNIKN